MVAPKKTERMMPNRRIAYEYTCVMYLAQQFEEEMRVILFLGDQWGDLPELKLTERERKQYKDDINQFLSEKGTCGRLLKALEQAGLVKNSAVLAKVVGYRNELAHWFLVEADFDNLDSEREKKLIKRLHEMALHFYPALTAIRKVRAHFERNSEFSQQALNKMMDEFGIEGLSRESPKFRRKQKPN